MKVVRLSPVDHIFTGPGSYPVQFCLKYSSHLDADKLREGLRSVIPIFWPIAGRLRKSSAQTYEIVWDGAVPNLEVISCRNQLFPELSDAKALLGLSSSIESSPGKPLSHFSLFEFENGSALVVNISHCVVDGYSLFYFLSQWAARVRLGPLLFLKNRIFAKPVHDRNSLVPNDPLVGDLECTDQEVECTDQEVYKKLGLSYSKKNREQNVEECVWQFRHYSQEDINNRRNKDAIRHLGKALLSSNDIISAIVIKQALADGWFSNGVARISIAFDYRRVLPGLSPRYFGNAVRAASFEERAEDIEEMTEIDIARQVRKAKDSISLENSLESLRYLEIVRLGPCGGLNFLQGMRVVDEGCGLLLTDISRASTDQFDFGCGIPTQLIPLTAAERTAVITSQQGGYSVRLSPPHGSSLDGDPVLVS